MNWKIVLVASFVLSACRPSTGSESTVKNVFGGDDRQEITTDQYPWKTIGRVLMPDGAACTGTLVDHDMVLTAAHCVIDPETKELYDGTFKFQANYKNGVSARDYVINWFWWGTNDPDNYRYADWALLRTSEPAGDHFGWIGIKSTTVANFPSELTVAGYSGNFRDGETAGIHHNCTTRKRDTVSNFLLHDCDSSRGSSGGPALRMYDGDLTIVGINVAERRNGGDTSLYRDSYDDAHGNVVIPSEEAVTRLLEIRAQ